MARSTPRPRDVVGYQAARDAGQLPHAPAAEPPTPVGSSARALGVRCAWIFGLLTAGWVALFVAVSVANVAPPLLVLLTGAVWFVTGWWLLGRVGDRLLSELAAGYASFTFVTGNLWLRVNGWTSWEFSGVWRLVGGRWLAPEPSPETDPPGVYPSAARPGRWEVWTGSVWTGVYRNGPVTPPE